MTFIIKGSQTGFTEAAMMYAYYFGWLIAYYFFKATGATIKLDRLLVIFCLCVIVEAVLINTIIPASYWPNYPDLKEAAGHKTAFFGFYQRPYSIGNNTSVSSTILCLMLFYMESLRKKNIIKIMNPKLEALAFIALILFASGTGLIIYLFYIAYRMNLFSKKNFPLLFLFILIIICLSNYESKNIDYSNRSILSKISSDYLNYLFEFKKNQIDKTVFTLQRSSMIFGNTSTKQSILIGSDFAILNLFYCLGISGLLSLIIYLVIKHNKLNSIIILVGILGTFHYGAIFSLFGQLLFAYTLIISPRNVDCYIKAISK
jgi:hypothetical protein